MRQLALKAVPRFDKGFFLVWDLDLSPKWGGVRNSSPTSLIVRTALSPTVLLSGLG